MALPWLPNPATTMWIVGNCSSYQTYTFRRCHFISILSLEQLFLVEGIDLKISVQSFGHGWVNRQQIYQSLRFRSYHGWPAVTLRIWNSYWFYIKHEPHAGFAPSKHDPKQKITAFCWDLHTQMPQLLAIGLDQLFPHGSTCRPWPWRRCLWECRWSVFSAAVDLKISRSAWWTHPPKRGNRWKHLEKIHLKSSTVILVMESCICVCVQTNIHVHIDQNVHVWDEKCNNIYIWKHIYVYIYIYAHLLTTWM